MTVRPGEVIGLVGENGAGKSTLMKILGGVIAPDSGTITIDGIARQVADASPSSMGAGIAFVHQELNLFDNLDVAANVYIGREPRTRRVPASSSTSTKQREMVAPLLKRVGANFTPATPVAHLSLAQRQMVEIAKALSIKCAAGHPRRADLEPAARRDRQAARRHRGAEGRRHQRHLHLAPPARDRARRRPRRRAARRHARRHARQGATSPRPAWSS